MTTDPATVLGTSDLVAQLRAVAEGAWRIQVSVTVAVCAAAADELERLRGAG